MVPRLPPRAGDDLSIIQRRIAATGAVGATVEAEGSDRIVVTLPGIADPDAEPIRKLDRPDRPRRLRATWLDPGHVAQTIDSRVSSADVQRRRVTSASVDPTRTDNPPSTSSWSRRAKDLRRVHRREYRELLRDHRGRRGHFRPGDPERSDGEVQVPPAGASTDLMPIRFATFVLYLDSGALPFPIYEVGPHAASPSPRTP